MYDFPIIWGLGIKGELVAILFLIFVVYKLYKWIERKFFPPKWDEHWD